MNSRSSHKKTNYYKYGYVDCNEQEKLMPTKYPEISTKIENNSVKGFPISIIVEQLY